MRPATFRFTCFTGTRGGNSMVDDPTIRRRHDRASVFGFVAAIALAGCGDRSSEQAANQPSAAEAEQTNYQRAVLDLPKRQRDTVLFRAIRDAGHPCQDIVSSERMPDQKLGPTWRAKCDD